MLACTGFYRNASHTDRSRGESGKKRQMKNRRLKKRRQKAINSAKREASRRDVRW